MNCKILWSEQVESYVKSKAPEPRRELWRALKALATWNGKADPPRIRHLEDKLLGYTRVRVNEHRVIFYERYTGTERVIECVFAGQRSTVYEAFQELLANELSGKPGDSEHPSP